MTNQNIQSFWFSRDVNKVSISVIELLCVTSYLANNHCFHLYTYTPNDASMQYFHEKLQGHKNYHLFCIKDAREILDPQDIFLDNRGSVGIAAFSDYFRFNLLYQKGGWWADMDTVCLRPIDLSAPYAFASQRCEDGEIMATTCMLKAPKESEFMKKIVETAKEKVDNAPMSFSSFGKKTFLDRLLNKIRLQKSSQKVVEWGIIGPAFLCECIQNDLEYQKFICPPSYFCEIDWMDAEDFVKKTHIPNREEIYVMHVWNAMWEMYGLKKDATYPKDTIIEQLKSLYLK